MHIHVHMHMHMCLCMWVYYVNSRNATEYLRVRRVLSRVGYNKSLITLLRQKTAGVRELLRAAESGRAATLEHVATVM